MTGTPHDEAEWQTRRDRIDKRLAHLGWTLERFHPSRSTADLRRHAVAEYPTDAGPADYALFVDGVILGIVEAKKLSRPSSIRRSSAGSSGASGR